MAIPKSVFRDIVKRATPLLSHAESLHLSSIAKSIEDTCPCHIYIKPYPTKGKPPLDIDGCLMTCETAKVVDRGVFPMHRYELIRWRDHFIFYKRGRRDKDRERWCIAHELGHCALHWPLEGRKHKTVRWTVGSKQRDGYMIEYSEKDEREADAFACLLTAHRPAPQGRKRKFELDDGFFEKVEEYMKRGYLQSEE